MVKTLFTPGIDKYESEWNHAPQAMKQGLGRNSDAYVMEDRMPEIEENGEQTSGTKAYESARNPVSQGMEQTFGSDLEDYVTEDREPQMEIYGTPNSDMETYGYDENPETMVMGKSHGWGMMAGSIEDRVPSENSIEKSKEVSQKTMYGNHERIEVVEGIYVEEITAAEGKNIDEEDADRNVHHPDFVSYGYLKETIILRIVVLVLVALLFIGIIVLCIINEKINNQNEKQIQKLSREIQRLKQKIENQKLDQATAVKVTEEEFGQFDQGDFYYKTNGSYYEQDGFYYHYLDKLEDFFDSKLEKQVECDKYIKTQLIDDLHKTADTYQKDTECKEVEIDIINRFITKFKKGVTNEENNIKRQKRHKNDHKLFNDDLYNKKYDLEKEQYNIKKTYTQ
jgi:cell division protein FtsB